MITVITLNHFENLERIFMGTLKNSVYVHKSLMFPKSPEQSLSRERKIFL